MKKTFLQQFIIIICLTILFTFAITSCGGGGGGGGGGSASGPAPESTDDSSTSAPAAPAPIPSALAEITSFSFTQADNVTLNADLNGNPQTVNNAASVQVYYAFNSQQNEDFENLKPVIEISEGATISPDPDETQNLVDLPEYTTRVTDMRDKLRKWFAKYVNPSRDAAYEAVNGFGQNGRTGIEANGECPWEQAK